MSDSFDTLAEAHGVIELPSHFSHSEAGEAGVRLLEGVRSLVSRRRKPDAKK